jgi:STE24 endopeptidase
MQYLTAIFVTAVVTSTLARWWLSIRQVHHVQAHRAQVPMPFADQIDLAAHTKAADYTTARQRFGRLDLLLDVVILLALTLGGGIEYLDTLWCHAALSETWHGVAVILSLMFIQTLISLPLAAWSTFKIEAHFGFNKVTPSLFIVDTLKEWLIGLALGAPLLFAVIWLMNKADSLWWLYAWIVLSAFSLVINWAWPKFIAPLFNKFAPLSDQTLKERIGALLQRCGFQSQGVFVMDGSKRSTHGNAYFTGFGKNKRVVFFDTLIQTLQPSEIEAVLAHELGHYKRHHIRNGLLFSLAMSFAGLALLGWLTKQPEFYSALGVSTPSAHAALLLFMLALSPILFWITPLSAWWSRRQEFQADEYAASQANANDLVTALTKMYRDNASTLTPDELHSAFYDSHPPALTRIKKLQQLGLQQLAKATQ